MNKEEILIIGGGVIGVCAAYFLSKRGYPVTLVEKNEICSGSSYGNAGWIAVGHAVPMAAPGVLSQGLKWMLDRDSPFYIKPRLDLDLVRWLLKFRAACTEEKVLKAIPVLLDLGRRSLDLFENLVNGEGLECGYHHKGLVHLFVDRKKYQKEVEETELLKSFGVETSLLDVEALREREPNLHSIARYGIYYPDYAHIIPDRFVSELARVGERMGAEICTQTEVLGFETANGRIRSVHTSRRTLKPDQVVLAAGAWSVILARQLGLRLPLQPAKGYSLTFDRPPIFPNTPLSLVDHKIAITPMGDKLRCTSTLELAGFDSSLSQRRLAAIHREAGKYLPGIAELEPEMTWSGFRPASPDGLPIIERSASLENLVLATGHGMLGITQGPITGMLVSQIVARDTPEIDLSPLSLDRFS